MANSYKDNDIGALFLNTGRNKPRAPYLSGSIVLSPALVRQLFRLVESKESAKVLLAAWKNTSADGERYFTVKAQPEYQPDIPSRLPLDDEDELDP